MIKKLVVLSTTLLLGSSSLFSATDKEIMDFFKMKGVPIKTLKILNRDKIKNSDIEVVKISNGKGNIFLFTNGNYIFQDIIDVKTGQSYTQKMASIKLKELLKSEKRENFVNLGDPKKPLITIFIDPECPYCRKEVAKMEDILKDNSIRLIFTPVHRKTSLQKSALIYKNTKDLKSDSDKIKVIRKYFDRNAKIDQNVSDAEVKRIDTLRKKYFSNGLRGVPFRVKEDSKK